MYILCEKDNYPEIILTVENNEVIGKCDSCGHFKNID